MEMYEFEISDYSASPVFRRVQFPAAEAAIQFAKAIDASQCVIYVAHIVDQVDYGNLYIWRNNDIAYLRLDEHREHFASDLSRSLCGGEKIKFFDEDGTVFEVSSPGVIDWIQAFDALLLWLRSGAKLPSLSWS
jgi:hypothetical protein